MATTILTVENSVVNCSPKININNIEIYLSSPMVRTTTSVLIGIL
jgi:hypothetical protein